MRWVSITVIWGVAVGLSLAFAAATRIGPVIASFGAVGTHGVHLGDLLGVGVCAALAAMATARVPPDQAG